jgi:hypothetical protein
VFEGQERIKVEGEEVIDGTGMDGRHRTAGLALIEPAAIRTLVEG